MLNLGMHVGQAIVLGAWRGLMAEGGMRGPRASAIFAVVRLANDQTLENVTGEGAPPWTWPRDELVIDVLHKGVYAFHDRPHRRRACRRLPGLDRGAQVTGSSARPQR